MFCGKTANKEISRAHKRALSILLINYDASFDEFLVRKGRKNYSCSELADAYD